MRLTLINGFRTAIGILDGIVDQVSERLTNQFAIAGNVNIVRYIGFKLQRLFVGHRLIELNAIGHTL